MTNTPHTTALRRRRTLGSADFQELLARARSGESDAFAELTFRLRPLVASCASSCGVRAADIDDIVQETWMRLHRHLGNIHTAASLPGWIAVTARRLSWSTHRSARPQADWAEVERLTDPSADPTRPVERDEDAMAVRAALAGLPQRDRALLTMTVLADERVPYRVISRELDCAIGSIGMFRRRSLDKVARALGGPVPMANGGREQGTAA